MIKQRPTFGSTRYKKGFALFPVSCYEHTVWLQSYEVYQIYNVLYNKWENAFFTSETFGDWRKI